MVTYNSLCDKRDNYEAQLQVVIEEIDTTEKETKRYFELCEKRCNLVVEIIMVEEKLENTIAKGRR